MTTTEEYMQGGKIGRVLVSLILVSLAVAGCMTVPPDEDSLPTIQPANTMHARDLFMEKAYPDYATGYSVEYHGTYKVVRIHDPWGRSSENHVYLLVQRGEDVPAGYPNARVFYIPVESVITLSLVQVPYLAALNETTSIRGHNGIPQVHNEAFCQLADEGKIIEIGSGTLSMNNPLKIETIIELEPDIVFCVSSGNREYDSHYKMQEAGLSPVLTAEWMEDHPLSRAEWIKYYSLFFNREEAANEIFAQIQANYTSIRENALNATSRPAIFSGIDYQGTWYAPGGNSYVAQLFRDAGGDYFLETDTGSGDIPLDFEMVYEKAHDAEFWLNIGFADNIDELMALDPRYRMFGAYSSGRMYHFNARVNPYGGNDYWQSGMVNPDIILADLVKILHPELLPGHQLCYYRQFSVNSTGDPDEP